MRSSARKHKNAPQAHNNSCMPKWMIAPHRRARGISISHSIAETDDYIIAKARQLYGYMMPGEMRFVIKNPEALYGGQTIEMYVVEGDQP